MRFALTVGAVTAVALFVTPLAAQQHDHGMHQDTAAAGAQHGCAMSGMGGGMMGATDSAQMKGMPGMMAMMAQDSAMMAAMQFSPQHVLAHGEALGLTPDQVRKIEGLVPTRPHAKPMDKMPMSGMPMDTIQMKMQKQKMHETAATVRDLLSPEQRAHAVELPMSCGMMDGEMGMGHPMGADTVKGASHDAHHR